MARGGGGKDRAALQRLYHEDLSYGHTDGVVVDKQGQIERTITPADRDFTAVDAEGVAVRVYGDQAYVTATYTFHIQQAGQPPRSARLSGLDVWTKAGGSWQLIARQLTRPTP
ncbi:MAG: nuclear transport factor 2 family protein [Mesorhizobium sp.]